MKEEKKLELVEAVLEKEKCRTRECNNTAIVAVKVGSRKHKFYIVLCANCVRTTQFWKRRKYSIEDVKKQSNIKEW